jgi:hypothetical protein
MTWKKNWQEEKGIMSSMEREGSVIPNADVWALGVRDEDV